MSRTQTKKNAAARAIDAPFSLRPLLMEIGFAPVLTFAFNDRSSLLDWSTGGDYGLNRFVAKSHHFEIRKGYRQLYIHKCSDPHMTFDGVEFDLIHPDTLHHSR